MNLTKYKSTAFKSDHPNYKHCAIVIKGGNILALSYNKGDKHAEVNALERIWPDRRKGTLLISLRFTSKGLANSKPCKKCLEYMISNRVGKYQYIVKYLKDLPIVITEKVPAK